MGRVVFTRSAQTDLFEAWLFIAEENQAAADRTLDSIAEVVGDGGVAVSYGIEPDLVRATRLAANCRPNSFSRLTMSR